MSDELLQELRRRQDEMESRQQGFIAAVKPRLEALEPVTREAAKRAQVAAVVADGNIVKPKKGAATSATLQASVTGVVTGLFAAWSAYESGNLEAAGAALGAAVTAMIAIWGRMRVGDLK